MLCAACSTRLGRMNRKMQSAFGNYSCAPACPLFLHRADTNGSFCLTEVRTTGTGSCLYRNPEHQGGKEIQTCLSSSRKVAFLGRRTDRTRKQEVFAAHLCQGSTPVFPHL